MNLHGIKRKLKNNMRFDIKLRTVSDVALFVSRCAEYPVDIDYIYKSKYRVDASSLMGVLGAGIGIDAEVEIHTDEIDILESFSKAMFIWKV